MTKPSPVYRAGTLSYTRAGLALLFFWLLAGDVIYVLIDQIEPRVLPLLLREHGASDQQISVIVGSIISLLNLMVTPVLGYRSDRLRSRWGRRIPYLFWATPFVSLFLAITPYAPEIAGHFGHTFLGQQCLALLPWSPVISTFAALVALYQFFEMFVGSIYFYLFRDVVPETHLGRFLTLFRVFGAIATFILNYWVLGLSSLHAKDIFLALAALNFIGFMALCWFVREGEYPPVVESVPATAQRGWIARTLHSCTIYFRESFSHPIYRWMHLSTLAMYGTAALTPFLLFFSRDELGMTVDQTGKLMSWSSVAWLVFAYPIGTALDRRGSFPILLAILWVLAICSAGSFLYVVGPATFLVSATLLGMGYWVMMLARLKLVYDIFHVDRLGQLSSASALVKATCLAFVLNPLIGWTLDHLREVHVVRELPLAGPVMFTHYRFSFLFLVGLYATALVSVTRVRSHWRRLGGPAAYQAPL